MADERREHLLLVGLVAFWLVTVLLMIASCV